MKQPNRKTRVSWEEPGHAHFVTYSCFKQLPMLTRDRTRTWIIDAMTCVRREQAVSLWAYVIMPEHIHVLMHPQRDDYSMNRILAGLKRPVSQSAKSFLTENNHSAWLDRLTVRYPSRTVFRFWQAGGGFDHNVFREKTIPAVVSYIHDNPVRRGLVESATDWVWSSARYWNGDKDVPLEMNAPFE